MFQIQLFLCSHILFHDIAFATGRIYNLNNFHQIIKSQTEINKMSDVEFLILKYSHFLGERIQYYFKQIKRYLAKLTVTKPKFHHLEFSTIIYCK